MSLTNSGNLFQRKVIRPFLTLLSMGITPGKLALTIAFGVVIGIMPFFGLATLLCTLTGIRLRLNVPALLLICYLTAPLHLVLYLPFIKIGIWLFGASEFRFTFDEIVSMFQKNWYLALEKIWLANMLGVLVWLVLSIPIAFLIYQATLPFLRKYIPAGEVSEKDAVEE